MITSPTLARLLLTMKLHSETSLGLMIAQREKPNPMRATGNEAYDDGIFQFPEKECRRMGGKNFSDVKITWDIRQIIMKT